MDSHQKPTTKTAGAASDFPDQLELLEASYKTLTNSLTNELNDLRESYKNLSTQNHLMDKDVLKKNAVIQTLKERITIKDKEIARKEEQLLALKERNNKVESDFDDFQQKVFGVDLIYDQNIHKAKEEVFKLQEKQKKMEEESSLHIKQIEMAQFEAQSYKQKLLELEADFSKFKFQSEKESAENKTLMKQLNQLHNISVAERDAKENEYKSKNAELHHRLLEIQRRLEFPPAPKGIQPASDYTKKANTTCCVEPQVPVQNVNPRPEFHTHNDFEDSNTDSETRQILNLNLNSDDESSSSASNVRRSSIEANETVVRGTSESSNKFI